MLRTLLFISLMGVLLCAPALSQPLITHQNVKDVRQCYSGVFEDYDSWMVMIKKSNQRKAKTEQELAQRLEKFSQIFPEQNFNKYKASIDCNIFKYKVDDIWVEGYVMKPKGSQNLPVLVYNRGGNGRYGAVVFAQMLSSLFPVAEQGFVLIGSQYRGAFDKVKAGAYDEFGGADVKDVVVLTQLLEHVQGADADRLGMFGSSRGGMQTFLAMQQIPSVKAVAVRAGASDLLKELKNRPSMENVYKKRIPNYAENKVAELEKRSVLKWAEKLNKQVPILLQHGDKDTKVFVDNAKWLAERLAVLEHPHKLTIFTGEGHSFSAQAKQKSVGELVNWFQTHL